MSSTGLPEHGLSQNGVGTGAMDGLVLGRNSSTDTTLPGMSGARPKSHLTWDAKSSDWSSPRSAREVEDIARYLRRMTEVISLIPAAESVTERDSLCQDAQEFWGLAFQNRTVLNRYAREFLGHVLTYLSSDQLLTNDSSVIALKETIDRFASIIRGITEKDLDLMISRLDASGLSLAEPFMRSGNNDDLQKTVPGNQHT